MNRDPSRGTRYPLKPLAAYEGYEPRVAATVLISLGLTVVLYAVSMPLPWHHRVVETGGFTVVRGIDGASWLIVAAAIAIGFLGRFIAGAPGFYAKWLFTIATVLIVIGIFSDYINWRSRAGQLQMPAYFGPGFYVALVGTAALVLANVLAWRTE